MSLPGILEVVEEIAGTAKALELARRHGGTRIAISAVEGSALVKVVGRAAAMELVLRLGRGRAMVPMAHVRGQKGRRAAAAAMLARGAHVQEVVQACDVHERTAWRVKAKVRTDPPLPLFDEGEG